MAAHDPAETRTRDSIDKTVEFVRLGFHDVSLSFTVRLGATDHLADVFNACGPYNDFDPERAFLALAPVFPKCMAVEFGRDTTPTLALELPHWEHQQIGFVGSRKNSIPLEREIRHAIAEKAVAALRAAGVAAVTGRLVAGDQLVDFEIHEGEPVDPLPSGAGITIRGTWH